MLRRKHGLLPRRTLFALTASVCLAAVVAAFLVSAAYAETIYYWKDPQGRYHFYTKPPKGFVPRSVPEKNARTTSAPHRRTIERLAELYGKRHRVDPLLVKAIIEVESDYDTHSVSTAGAQGLMQIMPETQKELGVNNPFDATENIEAGVRYFRTMLDRFKNVRLALAAYNAGPSAVEKYGGIPPFAETKKYVTKVLTRYRYNRLKADQHVQSRQ